MAAAANEPSPLRRIARARARGAAAASGNPWYASCTSFTARDATQEATMTTKSNGVWAAALVVLAQAALAQGDATATKFLTDAIRGNIAEVKMGELAQQRGKSDDVRDYGETLAKDHSMGAQKTTALAKKLGITAPTEPPADALQTYEALAKLSGEEFDHQFAAHMVMGHQKEIAKYTEQSRDASNPEVAALAKETLPTLEKHLATAQALSKGSKH
jgi:putative membrane protein